METKEQKAASAVDKFTALVKSPKVHAALPLIVVAYYTARHKLPQLDDLIAMIVAWCSRIGALFGALGALAAAVKKKPDVETDEEEKTPRPPAV